MKQIYRSSSIEKLSNPDQLDKAIKITTPMSWMALLGIFLIIIAVIVWGFCGTLPETKEISGVIVSSDNIGTIYCDENATISKIVKKIGDKVSKNENILKIKMLDGTEKNIIINEDAVITNIMFEEGASIHKGDEIIKYTPTNSEKQLIVCYVPVSIAKQLKKDMKVLVYPSSVDSQKYGHMEACIKSISDYPVTTSNMWYILGNDNMMSEQFISNGPVIEVICSIKMNSNDKNKFYWSNEKGKDINITTGTFISGKVVTSEDAPITKLIGIIKDRLEV